MRLCSAIVNLCIYIALGSVIWRHAHWSVALALSLYLSDCWFKIVLKDLRESRDDKIARAVISKMFPKREDVQ